jgi:hypothetical protein
MQNEINLTLTAAQLQALDEALAALETIAQACPDLSAADKATLVKPPEGARDWLQNMLIRAQQNLNHLPRDFDPALVQTDLTLSTTLNPRLLRLQRITERLSNAVFLADSDAFGSLLEARRRLLDAKVTGTDDNLDAGMSRFFIRPRRAKDSSPAK